MLGLCICHVMSLATLGTGAENLEATTIVTQQLPAILEVHTQANSLLFPWPPVSPPFWRHVFQCGDFLLAILGPIRTLQGRGRG